jgi:hypothetical protein
MRELSRARCAYAVAFFGSMTSCRLTPEQIRNDLFNGRDVSKKGNRKPVYCIPQKLRRARYWHNRQIDGGEDMRYLSQNQLGALAAALSEISGSRAVPWMY